MWDSGDAVVTGVVRGVPISTEYRWLLLHNAWLVVVAGGIGGQIVLALMWWMVGRSAGAEPVMLVAYLISFFTGIAALGWAYRAPFWYVRLRSALRRAEAN
jgi:hypothetical protein